MVQVFCGLMDVLDQGSTHFFGVVLDRNHRMQNTCF